MFISLLEMLHIFCNYGPIITLIWHCLYNIILIAHTIPKHFYIENLSSVSLLLSIKQFSF